MTIATLYVKPEWVAGVSSQDTVLRKRYPDTFQPGCGDEVELTGRDDVDVWVPVRRRHWNVRGELEVMLQPVVVDPPPEFYASPTNFMVSWDSADADLLRLLQDANWLPL